MPDQKKSLKINYIKTNNYRSFYVDGIHGGLTPKLKLYMDLFIDRNITPKIIEHSVNENGILNNDVKIIESKEGTAREIECGLIMDMETAKSIHEWLGKKIEEYDNIINKMIKEKH